MTNSIVLISDEHNPLFTSVYGHPFVKTPNMEKMAQKGTVYKNTYCPSPVCVPSRSAFISGKRNHDIQVYNNSNVNLASPLSYGKALADQGVYSVYIGRIDAYDKGENLGFSEVIDPGDRKIPGDDNFLAKSSQGAAQRANGYGVKENTFAGDLRTIDTAIDWLNNKAPEIEEPWVMTIGTFKPHFPHWARQEYWDMYEGYADLPNYGRDCKSANHPYAKDIREYYEADFFDDEQTKGLRRGYYACVSFVDEQIGRLMDHLENSGQSADTNFIYTSDHGEMLGKFGMWWKCTLYEDSVRIPCIATGPDFDENKLIETPVDLFDIQASLFASTDVDRPENWVGKPLQEVEENDPERVVFSEYHGHGTRAGSYMIRKGDWKLIYYIEAEDQLFNLAEDPDELNNLYYKNPDKAKELEAELRKICDPEKEDQKAKIFQKKQMESIINKDY
ncbi:sulfatase-like hydrolase/transferase [Natronospora cellulosivora (SeqCode)]